MSRRNSMRKISENFINNLKDEEGLLYPIFNKIQHDDTLMLAIRDNYINIYYRGGNILEITEKQDNMYKTFFDKRYIQNNMSLDELPNELNAKSDAEKWKINIPYLKENMDIYFAQKNKNEREFQQLVFRENNNSRISNTTEYFITDVEYKDKDKSSFDMLACKWLANNRQDETRITPSILEMKYGEGSIQGAAGIKKHLEDISAFISDNNKYETLLNDMESQINQLNYLGLINFNQNKNFDKFQIDYTSKPEVIFVLANYNPRSLNNLKNILKSNEIQQYIEGNNFDLKFFVSSFSGYAMHSACMWSYDQFLDLLNFMAI